MKSCRRRLPYVRLALLLAPPMVAMCGDDPSPPSADAAASDDGRGSSDAPDGPSDACMAQAFVNDARDIDIIFVVSVSTSMATIDPDAAQDSRWSAASSAIHNFVANFSGQAYGAGLLLFPVLRADGDSGTSTEACADTDYTAPVVPIAALDASGAQASAFEAALGPRPLAGGNTMAAALAGALSQAARRKSRTGHVVETVLVTDGAPDPCGASIDDAAKVAGAAYQTDHLETYVLAVGPDASTLDVIAAAGGTSHGYTGPGTDGLTAALASLGATTRRCRFYFPMVLSRDEFLRTSMVLDYGKSTEQLLPVVMDGSACRPNGWFYNSAEAPAYGIFCPATCDLLLQNPDRNVTALLACR